MMPPDRKELLAKEYPYLQGIMRRQLHHVKPEYHSEVESAAMVDMVLAAINWDPKGLITFRSYVAKVMVWRMTDTIREWTKFNRQTREGKHHQSIDETLSDNENNSSTVGDMIAASGPASRDPVELLLAHERLNSLWRLTAKERLSIILTLQEAADLYDVSESRMSQIRTRARRKLEIPLSGRRR